MWDNKHHQTLVGLQHPCPFDRRAPTPALHPRGRSGYDRMLVGVVFVNRMDLLPRWEGDTDTVNKVGTTCVLGDRLRRRWIVTMVARRRCDGHTRWRGTKRCGIRLVSTSSSRPLVAWEGKKMGADVRGMQKVSSLSLTEHNGGVPHVHIDGVIHHDVGDEFAMRRPCLQRLLAPRSFGLLGVPCQPNIQFQPLTPLVHCCLLFFLPLQFSCTRNPSMMKHVQGELHLLLLSRVVGALDLIIQELEVVQTLGYLENLLHFHHGVVPAHSERRFVHKVEANGVNDLGILVL